MRLAERLLPQPVGVAPDGVAAPPVSLDLRLPNHLIDEITLRQKLGEVHRALDQRGIWMRWFLSERTGMVRVLVARLGEREYASGTAWATARSIDLELPCYEVAMLPCQDLIEVIVREYQF